MTYDPSFRSSFMDGVNKFQNARMKAFWEEMLALMRGKPAELMSFEEIRTRLRLSEESYRGLQEIEVAKIVGSVGRYRDFTASFLPKSGKMQERWSRVYAQAHSMVGLPPIEVYKVGDVYFVRDGNHRVSVARQLNIEAIEAHVTELNTPVSLHPNMSSTELNEAAAYATFLSEAGLKTVRPHHQLLELSEVSRYSELLGHIQLHKSLLDHLQGRELPISEAAAHWYDNVYRPAVTLIRKYHILEGIPQRGDHPRTEADLYLWMVDHLQEVRHQYSDETRTRYSDALVDFLTEKNLAVPKELIIENDAHIMNVEPQWWQVQRYDDYNTFSGNNVYQQLA